jgi:energy-coupling factor transporter ATP-binding protein EcfA2
MTTPINELGPAEIAIIQSITKAATEKALSTIGKIFKSPKPELKTLAIQDLFSAHALKVANWAASYTFVGLGTPKSASTTTMALRFNLAPRRFRKRSSGQNQSELHENELLQGAQSILILGEPGSGKTTTLRRLALSVLHEKSTSSTDDRQFVILIILRELAGEKFICEFLAETLGLPYTKTRLDEDTNPGGQTNKPRSRLDFKIEINGRRAEQAIGAMCDALSVVLLIDGLDEIPPERRDSIEKELEEISLSTQNTTIITSCRSGDFIASLQGFRVVEIAPLNEEEIEGITKLWTPDPQLFIEALNAAPYRDIVDRPLLLSFLLFLFCAEGKLPERPSSIYRKVVYRLLREWDEERRIERVSKYANFDPDQKIDFLSEVAYEMTYNSRSKIFSEEIFQDIYQKIAPAYSLPLTAHIQVATEIQTHTGIIVACGVDSFEFAHLSIQEYLCANYIVRTPTPAKLKEYFEKYPAPIAVACALSSNPSVFIAEMILRHLTERLQDWLDPLSAEPDTLQLTLFGADSERMLKSFLGRIKTENPTFRLEPQLGEAIICLFAFYYHRYSDEVNRLLCWLASIDPVKKSTSIALSRMNISPFKIRGATVGFNIDDWFGKMFSNFFGKWEDRGALAERLPIVVMPLTLLDSLTQISGQTLKIAKGVPDAHTKRVWKALKNTPFCNLESGSHNWGKDRLCTYCGAPQNPPRSMRVKLA